jgi:hypothetical protein
MRVHDRGRHWPVRLTQAQGPIDVRFAIGTELHIADLDDGEIFKIVPQRSGTSVASDRPDSAEPARRTPSHRDP